jgi:hypothetical protein
MLWSPPLRRKRQAIRACAPIWIIVPLCGVSGCMALGQLEQATALVARVPAAAVSTAQTGSEGTLPGTSPSATPRVAAAGPPAGLVAAPKPFSWSSTGKSTGGRPFQIMSAGREGYRTLVVGSVGGDDPIALELVERLARHVHDNGAILGGYETTIIRTLNPDGLANRKHVNQKGVYVNGAFPDGGADGAAGAGESLEVTFLLQQLKELQPQRVIHLRTVRGDKGVIAANAPASSVAREIAEWLNLQLVTSDSSFRCRFAGSPSGHAGQFSDHHAGDPQPDEVRRGLGALRRFRSEPASERRSGDSGSCPSREGTEFRGPPWSQCGQSRSEDATGIAGTVVVNYFRAEIVARDS